MKQPNSYKYFILSFITVSLSVFLVSCGNSIKYNALVYDYGLQDAYVVDDYPDSNYVTIIGHPGQYRFKTVTITKIQGDGDGVYLKDVHHDKISFSIHTKPDSSFFMFFVDNEWNFIHVPYYLIQNDDTLTETDLNFKKIGKDSLDSVLVYPNLLCDTLLSLDSPRSETVYFMYESQIDIQNKSFYRYFFKNYRFQSLDNFDLKKLGLKESIDLFGFSAVGLLHKEISRKELDRMTKGFRKNI